jgi:hypothetical protein
MSTWANSENPLQTPSAENSKLTEIGTHDILAKLKVVIYCLTWMKSFTSTGVKISVFRLM